MTKAKSTKGKGIWSVTPKAVAVFPKLDTPDIFKGNPNGYNVTFNFTKEQMEAQGLLQAQEELEAFYEATKAAITDKKKRDRVRCNDLYTLNEDGTYRVKFKSEFKPQHLDAKGSPLGNPPAIWGGSVIKVGYTRGEPYNFNDSIGISLKMSKVQIITLVTSGSSVGAGGGGFEPEEGGYEGDSKAKAAAPAAPEGMAADDSDFY